MYKGSTEIKVGIFVLIAILIFAWIAMQLGGMRFGSGGSYSINAVFPSAMGLKVGVAVEVAGIQVGKVSEISLIDGNQALVMMDIKEGIALPSDTAAFIKAQGILGDKYVELRPANFTGTSKVLEDGERITNAQASADMAELMSKLGDVADDLKSLTGAITKDGGGEDVRAIISNFKNLSDRLDRLVMTNEEGLGETLASLNKTMSNLENITNKINAGEGTLGQLINNETTVAELNSALTEIRSIATKINAGEGTIGRLVNDETTIDKIDKALTGINDYIEKDDKFKVYVEYRADYQFRHDNLKSTVNIRLQPAPDRYYLLGVTNDYFGKYSRTDYRYMDAGVERMGTEEKWDRDKLKFNAQIARRYYDLVLRGGLFESGAGFGIDYYMLDDTLKLTFEAFSADFDHNPHLRAMASYNIWKIFYVSLGFDDFISDQHRYTPFISLGIEFSDDDLKYLLGSGAVKP